MPILGGFAKLQRVTISFVLSVRPRIHLRTANRFPQKLILTKFDICVFFNNLSRKFNFY